MQKNEGFHRKMKPHQKIVNKKQANKDINKNSNIFYSTEYEYNTNKARSNKPSNLNKFRKMPSKLMNQTNKDNNSTTIKKSKLNNYNNMINSKKMKLSNLRGNKSHNLFLPPNNNNLKGDFSEYLSNNENNNINIGTKLDISKSEIQYPLNNSKNETKKNLYNNTNSSIENNNKEINLRISLKLGNKNNKEKIRNYNISSPSNKTNNNTFTKKLRHSMKYLEHNNKRKNEETNSPDIINYNTNENDKKVVNNNFFTKRENIGMNIFNSCYNFYKKDDINSKRRQDINFNNTMNYYDLNSNKIINNDENIFISDTNNDNINENNNKYIKYIKSNKLDISMNSSRYRYDGNYEEIEYNNKRNNNEKKYLSYQQNLLEEFCNGIEEFMFYIVKDNFDYFINKLKEYTKEKYFNFLLLKRLQTKNIKKKFYQNVELSNERTNNSYLSSTINNSKTNNKTQLYPSNNLSKEYVRRKTIDNFNNNVRPGISDNTYHRKSQGKIILKNFDSFYKNNYDTNEEKRHKERIISNEKYDTNLYIPKKYRQINNNTANKNIIKKNNTSNFSNIMNPYFTNINKTKESSILLNPDLDNNLSNEIEEEIIKSKLEKYTNINAKKKKFHNISCDNKYNSKYYMGKDIMNKINSFEEENNSMTMNIVQRKDNEFKKLKPIYNKKKIKISQPKSKIYISKQIQDNVKDKIIRRNDKNILKKEQMVNFNVNKKINNKNKNNNEHFGIMTLSSNLSESSNDVEIINEEKSVFNIISPKTKNLRINSINNISNNAVKENCIKYVEEKNNEEKQNEINNHKNHLNKVKSRIKKENGKNDYSSKLKEKKKNILINNRDAKMEINSDNYLKMSNGKKVLPENNYIEEVNTAREIIVKDVSTKDKRINVFIKYIEDSSFNNIYNNSNKNIKNKKKHQLFIFQTDLIFLPQAYPSMNEQKNDLYKNEKSYKNVNDKNHQNKMNKILSSIIEEEERSKAAGSMNGSIISDEENLINGNHSYFFIQSIKYFINFLYSIISDKKKTLYFQFFKELKKIKNNSFIKGLISQKKSQCSIKSKEKDYKEKNNTSGDIILYNINDNIDIDINCFNEVKIENKNPKNNTVNKEFKKETKNSLNERYSTDNNFRLIIDDNLYNLNSSNKKSNLNLSMDNFYMSKKRMYKYDKNILKKIINNTKINKKIKIDKIDLKDLEKNGNGQDEYNLNGNIEKGIIIDNNCELEKNITLSEACRRLNDVINDFRINLIKYGIRK